MTQGAISLLIEAGRLFTTAGAAALGEGRADCAIDTLTRARDILACVDEPVAGGHALELLLTALVEAGKADAADRLTASVDELECAGLEPRQLLRLRLQLARADAVAEETARGISRIHDARALLDLTGTQPAAALDITEAWLMTQTVTEGGDLAAEKLARRALASVGDEDQPQIACEAWAVLGIIARWHDLADSTACFRRSRLLAHKHRLPFCRLRAQLDLGVNEWLTAGKTERLQLVRQAATRSGALGISCSADAIIAMDLVFRGRYSEAARMIDTGRAQAGPAGLKGTLRLLAMIRSVLAAHQGRRPEMELAIDEFIQLGGQDSRLMPSAFSHSCTVCALLEEDREQACRDPQRAVFHDRACSGPYPLARWEGLRRLLTRMPGCPRRSADHDPETSTRTAENLPFWDLPFALLEQAVLLGMLGRGPEALALFARAEQAAEPYELLWHLALRLVGEAAYQDGWGFPAQWLGSAYRYFHDHPRSAVPSACQSLLRRNGAPVYRPRRDADRVPPELLLLGVTTRELEVLRVLMTRVDNKDIAAKLYISPRTVEKHIGSLLAKTGQQNRKMLIGFALGACVQASDGVGQLG